MPRFVLEIGTEEIPPRFFPPALDQLRRDGQQMLDRARLSFDEIKVYGAPRRLAFIAEGLAERQASLTREERGPAAKVAFDADGNPTKAAEGFARRHNLSPEDLVRKETEQGEYVFAIVQDAELPAKDALAALIADLITGLSFPKTMRWGTGKVRFGRPIRWLLALVDDEIVEFDLDGLRSGRKTRGHPVLANEMFAIQSVSDMGYENALREKFVCVDPDERRHEIGGNIEGIAEAAGARLVDGYLLEETTFLVEWPTAAIGDFDPAFLSLPRPVLIDEMQHVQSYFPLEGADGNLLPRFIAVRDGGRDHLDTVVRGWESVLRAKLIDATFFYEQDLKRPLADRVEDLNGVVFQERMGTLYDKAQRLRSIVAEVARQVGLPDEEREKLDRAAILCKADLTTEVVAELSALQGVIGQVYALESGEDAEVASAIGEHYRPRSADDATPETKLGKLLALADKIDTLAALFAVGLIPTGSADPFGLRREAAGIVAIGLDIETSFSMASLLDRALDSLDSQAPIERKREEIVAQIIDFIRQRLETYLREEEHIRYDLVDAALAVGIDDIGQAEKRAQVLALLQPQEAFLPTVIACTRPLNIAKGFDGGEVAPDLFQEPAEHELWSAYQQVLSEAQGKGLDVLFQLIAEQLRAPIDRYFDDVLVMAEDEKLRRNRLAMCWQLSRLFKRLGDLSLIVQA